MRALLAFLVALSNSGTFCSRVRKRDIRLQIEKETRRTPTCYCRELGDQGRCDANEKGKYGHLTPRAIEVRDEGKWCCKWNDADILTEDWSQRDGLCDNRYMNEINNIIENAVPDGNSTKQECQAQLEAFHASIETQVVENHQDFFFGKYIRTINSTHAAEGICHEMMTRTNWYFTEGVIGAHLFEHTQEIKLLWNGAENEERQGWKHFLKAGELSREDDTLFAKVVENPVVGHLRKCSYEMPAVTNIWAVASASYAGLAREKPLVILVGKGSQRELEETMLWRTELHGIAINPPSSNISVISIGGFNCKDLMKSLKQKIEKEVSDSLTTIKEKWGRIESFTCRVASRDAPDQHPAEGFLPPFGELALEESYWFRLADGGGGRVFGVWYSEIDCFQILVSMNPSRWCDVDNFVRLSNHAKFSTKSGYLTGKIEESLTTVHTAKIVCGRIRGCHGFYHSGGANISEHKRVMITFAGQTNVIGSVWTYTSYLMEDYMSSMMRDDDRLKTFTDFCPCPQSINFNTLQFVTDYGFKELATRCPYLNDIDISYTHITDMGMQELSKNCGSLEKLTTCDEVSDVGLDEIRKRCTNLQKIDVGGSECRDRQKWERRQQQ